MGQQVDEISKLKKKIKSGAKANIKFVLVYLIRPEVKWANYEQVDIYSLDKYKTELTSVT